MLLLHGFTGRGQSWADVAAPLAAAGYRVIAPDLPGHGDNLPRMPAAYGMERVAEALADLIDREVWRDRCICWAIPWADDWPFISPWPFPKRCVRWCWKAHRRGLATEAERAARRAADDALADRIEAEGIPAFVAFWESLALWQSQERLAEDVRQNLRRQRLQNSATGLAHSLREMGTGVQPSLWDRSAGLDPPHPAHGRGGGCQVCRHQPADGGADCPTPVWSWSPKPDTRFIWNSRNALTAELLAFLHEHRGIRMNYRRLSAISAGHFAIDVLNSSVAIILISMVGRFDLSNGQIALGTMFYTFAAALTQPFFGLLADRVKGRWLAAAGLTWTMIFFSASSFATTYEGMLGLLVIGALGQRGLSSCGGHERHPCGRDQGRGQRHVYLLPLWPDRAGSWDRWRRGWSCSAMGWRGCLGWRLAMLPAVVIMVAFLRQPIHTEHEAAPVVPASDGPAPAKPRMQIGWMALLAFVALIALRSTTLQSFTSLLPKFLADQGFTSGEYGRMMGAFSLAGAFGTLSGGFLADKFSRRQVIFVAMVMGGPVSFLLLNATGMNYYLLAVTAGFLLNIPHSILVVMAQRLLPKRQGLASGAVLGFMFASGAAAGAVVGWISDFTGLSVALHAVTLLPILAGLCALTLPATRTPKVL